MVYRVVIIESSSEIRKALNALLKQSPQFKVVATYKSMLTAMGKCGIYNPSLFLIDVENLETLSRLPILTAMFPKATTLCMMSAWNSDIADKVIESGATGCMLKPPRSVDKILEAINLYKGRGKPGLPYIISFFSPKGRSGRTTLAAMMAMALATKTGEGVALIDADLQFGDLPLFFDVEPQHTIADAVHDSKALTPMRLMPYFQKIFDNVWLLGSPERPEYAELVDSDEVIDILRMSKNLFKYILVDLPANFNPISIAVSEFADLNFVVSMLNTGLEINHMKRCMELLNMKKLPTTKFYPILTRVDPCNDAEKLKLELKIGFPILAIFPDEYAVISMANSGQILERLTLHSDLEEIVDNLAERIIKREL